MDSEVQVKHIAEVLMWKSDTILYNLRRQKKRQVIDLVEW